MEKITYYFNNTKSYIEQSCIDGNLKYSCYENSLCKVFGNLSDAIHYIENECDGEGVNEIKIVTTKTIYIQ